MQAIPEDAVQEDSGDEEEDDPNKRISSKEPAAALSRPLRLFILPFLRCCRSVFKGTLSFTQSVPMTRG